ncbi:MAG TPA: outer-membrane lipoprotein carrier protein LolA [Gemmatimonadales bacterium]|nr:outer-membrane lipoprotein carrier protein LolA [Gemmatimonadales bacterium]
MKFGAASTVAIVLTFAVAAGAGAQDAEAVALRASRVYRGLSSLRAAFEQTIEDRMIGAQDSRGELVQAGSANLAMRFSDPKGEAVVLDGTHVWVYTPSTAPGQVIRMAIPTDPVYGPNVLSRILDKPTERYGVRALDRQLLEGRPMDVVEFLPNVADPLFKRAVIWFDPQSGLPRRLVLDELTGVRRTLTLSRIRVNGPVTRKDFSFEIPAGVRVIER